jgi:hypothetical protein
LDKPIPMVLNAAMNVSVSRIRLNIVTSPVRQMTPRNASNVMQTARRFCVFCRDFLPLRNNIVGDDISRQALGWVVFNFASAV